MRIQYIHTIDKIIDSIETDIKPKIEMLKGLYNLRKHIASEWHTMHKIENGINKEVK